MRISRQDRGFTLVELMMAMLITIVGLMGLLQSVNLAMEHNLKSQLRDEAVLIGEQRMGILKAMPFSQVPPNTVVQIDSRLRAGFTRFYSVSSDSTPWTVPGEVGTAALRLRVVVTWTYKGITYTHEVRSIRSQ